MKGTIHKRIMNDFKPKEAPRLYITIKNISPDVVFRNKNDEGEE